MPIRPTDRIIGPSRGTAAKAKASFRERGALRMNDVAAFVDAVYLLCAPDDMPDAAIVISQADVETGTFTNKWWKERLNAGSLGVTGWGPDDAISPTFATGAAAAKAMVVHDLLYATGTIDRHGLEPSDDPRFAAYRVAYGTRAFPTLNDLSGRYAADTAYGATIARRSQVIYGDLPDQASIPPQGEGPMPELNMTKNLIPMPSYERHIISDSQNSAWDHLGQRTQKGFVLHRMLGGLDSTESYFRGGAPGLTDFGTDNITGKIYLWNDPWGTAGNGASANRSPWASGRVIAPYGDGAKFVNKYGVNAVNRDQVSWEIDGFYGDPWSEQAMQIAAQACAHFAHNYGITWEQFPIAPQDGFSFVRWHNEYTGMQEKECPGSVVMNQTNTFIGIVKGIMKAYQTAGVDEPEPQPEPTPIPVNPYPKGMTAQLARELYGSVKVSWADKPFTFDIDRSECRFWIEYGASFIPDGGDYRDGNWGELVAVKRRGNKGSGGRVYQWSNGAVYFQEPADKQTGPQQDAA
jgi:hypothetical protein